MFLFLTCDTFFVVFCIIALFKLHRGVSIQLLGSVTHTCRTHRDHLKCCCNDASYIPLHQQNRSINERLEHELETHIRNDEEERRRELMR